MTYSDAQVAALAEAAKAVAAYHGTHDLEVMPAMFRLRAVLEALAPFLKEEVCGTCGGSGRVDNHVTGAVECPTCSGPGEASK